MKRRIKKSKKRKASTKNEDFVIPGENILSNEEEIAKYAAESTSMSSAFFDLCMAYSDQNITGQELIKQIETGGHEDMTTDFQKKLYSTENLFKKLSTEKKGIVEERERLMASEIFQALKESK